MHIAHTAHLLLTDQLQVASHLRRLQRCSLNIPVLIVVPTPLFRMRYVPVRSSRGELVQLLFTALVFLRAVIVRFKWNH